VKKCVQCTKDLPDAALHCVFCGSRQPAQAPAAEVARTVMGYSANQVREQLAAQGAAVPPASPRHPPTAPPPMSGHPMGSSPAHPMAGSSGPNASPPASSFQPPASSFPPPAPAYQPPPQQAYQPPQQAYQPPQQAYQPPPQQAYQPPPQQAYQPPQQAYPQSSAPAFPPPVAASAATMFVPNQAPNRPDLSGASGPNGQPGVAHPMAATMAISSPMGGGMGSPMGGGMGSPMGSSSSGYPQPAPYVPPPPSSPYQPAPFVSSGGYQPQPVPQSPPYLASQTADRPIDPYRDGLRLVLFAFGILLLGAFCTPLSSAPTFHWDAILGAGPVAAKLPSLLLAVTGALAIIIASTPLASPSRGLLAVMIVLIGVATPIAIAKGVGGWRNIVELVLPFVLVPGLLLRQEYREELLPRLLVTLGVLATLALWLVPIGGALPLVAMVKAVVDAAGTAKVAPLLELVHMVLIVLTLLVWLPAPASGGAKLFAWILIFWPAVLHFQGLLLSDNVAELIKQTPFTSAMVWAMPVAYVAIFGYGLAALLGKRYESA